MLDEFVAPTPLLIVFPESIANGGRCRGFAKRLVATGHIVQGAMERFQTRLGGLIQVLPVCGIDDERRNAFSVVPVDVRMTGIAPEVGERNVRRMRRVCILAS